MYLTGSSVSCFITNSSCHFLTFYTRHFWWLAVLVRNSLLIFWVLLCDLSCSVYSQSYWCVKYNGPSIHEILICHARNSIRCQSVSNFFYLVLFANSFILIRSCSIFFSSFQVTFYGHFISHSTQGNPLCLQNFYECDI